MLPNLLNLLNRATFDASCSLQITEKWYVILYYGIKVSLLLFKLTILQSCAAHGYVTVKIISILTGV